jgi:hypothetical protein
MYYFCNPSIIYAIQLSDVQSINNNIFHNYIHLIYPDELEIKDTTESDKCAEFLNILLNTGSIGRITTTLYDKHSDFDFGIVNFPFLCSDIPFSPAYDIWTSKRGKLLTKKLILHGYFEYRLIDWLYKILRPGACFTKELTITTTI